ncbi:hypothetical protein HWV62_10597 [Athelia sp. TMB]|nr:hypothetical protein HWV62_10597 [Athelia sp. TMB]
MADPESHPAPRAKSTISSYLTTIAHGSSPFLTTFLLIHLSAPALANLGGGSLASQVMLLGREYYQTPVGEKLLLLAPLGLHVASGIAKRAISGSPSKRPRPMSTLLTITGYGTLAFLPIHFLTHRVLPTESNLLDLDYEYVKLGLQTWPWRSWVLYTGLVGCVLLHAAEGMNLIASTWGGAAWAQWKGSKRTRRIVAGAGALPVLTGLWVLFKEPLMAFPSIARQFEDTFTRSWVFRV